MNNDLTLALKDPTNLSDLELEEVEKAQLAALRKVKELLGEPSTSQSAVKAEKEHLKKTKRKALLRIKNKV